MNLLCRIGIHDRKMLPKFTVVHEKVYQISVCRDCQKYSLNTVRLFSWFTNQAAKDLREAVEVKP
jgi:hypothetical protein